MYFPNARLSKYSYKPTPALAVQEPNCPWSSIGEHHFLRSALVVDAVFFFFGILFNNSFTGCFTPLATCYLPNS